MIKYSKIINFSLISVLLAFTTQSHAGMQFEQSSVFNASRILTPQLLSGPNHQVDETVTNDGFLNVYTINSRFGSITAVSTAKLAKYINEINAAARMEAYENSDGFKKGIKDKAGDVVKGAGALISDPIGTTSKSLSGVGKLFSRAGENMFGGSRSENEGSRMADLTGFNKIKRDYGYEFGVDVYSHNELLQKPLNKLAKADTGGSLLTSGLLMAVPGGAGIAVSVSGSSQLMNNVFKDTAPADLRKMNRKKLAAMSVNKHVADIFIANGIYTPREQTLLVAALDSMKNTKNRTAFVKMATLAEDSDVAFFRQRQAEMYAAYDKGVEPIIEFVNIGKSAAGKSRDGKIIFDVPLDHALWTKGIAAVVRIATQNIALMKGVTGKELWVEGTLSTLAKQSMQEMGWSINEHAGKLLMQ